MAYSMIDDLEYDLMKVCLKFKGKWWANHFFRNAEVNNMYQTLRKLDAGTVICIVNQAKKGVHPYITAYKQKQLLDELKR